jgi:DME family drug/metabolite transporter
MGVLVLKRNFFLGYTCVLCGAILWGAVPIFSRMLFAAGYTPRMVSSMRSFLAALMSIAAIVLCGKIKKVQAHDLPFFILYGVFAIGLTFFLYATSTKMLPTAMAAILLYTGPAFVNILNRVFYKDRITKVKWIALFCTFGGCALVVKVYDFGHLSTNLIGIVIGLLSGLCYSMTTVLSRHAQANYSGDLSAWLIMIFGAIPFLAFQPPWTVPVKTPVHAELFIALAAVSSFIPYTLYLKGLDFGIDKGFASIVATLEPVTATILGAVTFNDCLEPIQVIGIMIVLAGITLPICIGKLKNTNAIHTETGTKSKIAGEIAVKGHTP